MCSCKETKGFSEQLAIAKKLTEQTGETHVVYVPKAVGVPYMRKESDMVGDLGICCYTLPTGEEVPYINANNVDVSEAEVITNKKAKNVKPTKEETASTSDEE
ncbi:hypothetical protein OX284_014255 [Flavobacterium sp. SUN046]|uniref:hypothetical protein n=1 Tax=Flavobacterium sp. SUN046 TaxID=3002440 RepID=UPI002DB99540|nr:hypothetical protein [Flavobacterium sp. SUN046]MEC4050598.1 hypothetical protein [Flavobacterium sp. SUN046]